MSTTFEAIYEPFFYKIENDKDFFVYYNLTSSEALVLAKQRTKSILTEAITRIVFSCTPDIDFTKYDTTTETFTETFTKNEINLIVQAMFEKFLERDVVKLKAFKLRFTPSDLNAFSPANERNSFMNMHEFIVYQSDVMIDHYASTDRLTGKKKMINYSSYEY